GSSFSDGALRRASIVRRVSCRAWRRWASVAAHASLCVYLLLSRGRSGGEEGAMASAYSKSAISASMSAMRALDGQKRKPCRRQRRPTRRKCRG
ncbi:unnamed protein product, partial [Musa hybrid cultivar]